MDSTLIYVDENYEVTSSVDVTAREHAEKMIDIAFDLLWNQVVNCSANIEDALDIQEKFEVFINNKQKELVASIKAE